MAYSWLNVDATVKYVTCGLKLNPDKAIKLIDHCFVISLSANSGFNFYQCRARGYTDVGDYVGDVMRTLVTDQSHLT